MQIGHVEYHRVTKAMHCPVCGRPDWCMIAEDKQHVLCARIPSKKKIGTEAGWLHPIGVHQKPKRFVKSPTCKPNLTVIIEAYKNMKPDRHLIYPLASHLGCKVETLMDMGVRLSGNSWGVPMYDEFGQMVGIKKRNILGKKWCVRHSRLGIYRSSSFKARQAVYICEGESDTAVMINAGYNAIGRASATSCVRIIQNLLANCPSIIIVPDYDKHGLGFKTACQLAEKFSCPVDIVMNREYKDIREWMNSGTFSWVKFHKLRKKFRKAVANE